MGVRWTNNRETILFDEDPHRLPYLKKLVSKPDQAFQKVAKYQEVAKFNVKKSYERSNN